MKKTTRVKVLTESGAANLGDRPLDEACVVRIETIDMLVVFEAMEEFYDVWVEDTDLRSSR